MQPVKLKARRTFQRGMAVLRVRTAAGDRVRDVQVPYPIEKRILMQMVVPRDTPKDMLREYMSNMLQIVAIRLAETEQQ